MPDLRIALTVTAETALSVGAAGSAGTLADTLIVRDGLGRPIIPGSQLKGKLRHAAEQFLRSLGHDIPSPFELPPRSEQATPIRTLFGSPQQVSALRFADLICDIDPHMARLPGINRVRPSVTINRRRGTAEDQHLLLRETAREGLVFQSDRAITGKLDSLAHAALLWAALRLSDRWGGAKSRGLGWCSLNAQIYWDNTPMSVLQMAEALRTLGGSSYE